VLSVDWPGNNKLSYLEQMNSNQLDSKPNNIQYLLISFNKDEINRKLSMKLMKVGRDLIIFNERKHLSLDLMVA